MKQFKILYFGNPHLPEDNLAVRVCESLKQQLPQFQFQHIKDTFQLVNENIENTIIVDLVQGIDDVAFIQARNLKPMHLSTTHDFDLGFFLKLTGKKPIIIGLPQDGDIEEISKKTKKLIFSVASKQ